MIKNWSQVEKVSGARLASYPAQEEVLRIALEITLQIFSLGGFFSLKGHLTTLDPSGALYVPPMCHCGQMMQGIFFIFDFNIKFNKHNTSNRQTTLQLKRNI